MANTGDNLHRESPSVGLRPTTAAATTAMDYFGIVIHGDHCSPGISEVAAVAG
jgi:hypothetical protein